MSCHIPIPYIYLHIGIARIQSLNRYGQIFQFGHQLRHVLLGIEIAVAVHWITASAQLKVELSEALLLLANVRHLVHGAARAEGLQFPEMEILEQAEQGAFHVSDVGNL